MIIYTKNTTQVEIPWLYAYSQGVFAFPFGGDETFTDPYDGSIWTWENVDNNLKEILGVTYGGNAFASVTSLVFCEALEQSFFWDDVNGILYVHHVNNTLDIVYGDEGRIYYILSAGYATDYNKNTNNFYDEQYYDPIIQEFTEITRTVDPLQFGLVSFNSLNYTISNNSGDLDNYTEQQAVGNLFEVYAIDRNSLVTDLTSSYKVFKGYHEGTENNRSTLKIKGVESRYFNNEPACQKTYSSIFTQIGDILGELYPVAFGQIRRGIAVPTNIEALTEANAGSCVLSLANPDIGSLLAISAVYDKDGNSLSITSTNLTACTVTVTKPAGISPNETKEYTWQGQGYDIDGTYNNPLDIIKACFLYYSNISYSSDFFDTTQWAAITAIKTEAVGLSVQDDNGWMDSILQPISTSIQSVVEFLGNGKITVFPRKLVYETPTEIDYDSINQDPSKNIKNEVVSEILVEYSPDFKKNIALTYLNNSEKEYVVNTYNINTRGSFSPLKTVLYNSSDAETLGDNLMMIYKDPGNIFNILSDSILDLDLFDLVTFNNERIFNGIDETIIAEVLSINTDYINEKTNLIVREFRG